MSTTHDGLIQVGMQWSAISNTASLPLSYPKRSFPETQIYHRGDLCIWNWTNEHSAQFTDRAVSQAAFLYTKVTTHAQTIARRQELQIFANESWKYHYKDCNELCRRASSDRSAPSVNNKAEKRVNALSWRVFPRNKNDGHCAADDSSCLRVRRRSDSPYTEITTISVIFTTCINRLLSLSDVIGRVTCVRRRVNGNCQQDPDNDEKPDKRRRGIKGLRFEVEGPRLDNWHVYGWTEEGKR